MWEGRNEIKSKSMRKERWGRENIKERRQKMDHYSPLEILYCCQWTKLLQVGDPWPGNTSGCVRVTFGRFIWEEGIPVTTSCLSQFSQVPHWGITPQLTSSDWVLLPCFWLSTGFCWLKHGIARRSFHEDPQKEPEDLYFSWAFIVIQGPLSTKMYHGDTLFFSRRANGL